MWNSDFNSLTSTMLQKSTNKIIAIQLESVYDYWALCDVPRIKGC